MFCAIMDDHTSGQEAVSTFLMLEFLDVGLDITTLVLTSASGDLEFANDHGGLVQAVLSWSVGFSVLMFCGELIGRKTLLDKVILFGVVGKGSLDVTKHLWRFCRSRDGQARASTPTSVLNVAADEPK